MWGGIEFQKNGCIMPEGLGETFVGFVNFTVERGDLKESTFRQLLLVFLDEVYTVFGHILEFCVIQPYSKLYPVFYQKPIEFFQL